MNHFVFKKGEIETKTETERETKGTYILHGAHDLEISFFLFRIERK